ncbi:MAG: ATP-dependent helicase [Pseudomonadota bacterium]
MAVALDTPDYLSTLNDEQRQAATYAAPGASVRPATSAAVPSGPLLIIAGAGTGKTMTLAHRVAHLIVNGVDPADILLLTFSRRAAAEMTRRAERIVRQALRSRGQAARSIRFAWSGTFHAIANRLLRIYARNLGLDPSFTVLDRTDAADLIDSLRQQQGLSARDKRFPKKDTCLAIYSRCVNTRLSLADVLAQSYPWCADWLAELNALFGAYVEAKQQHAVLDYDDLLLYWYHLVSEPALATDISARFSHVLVDEYQDTNRLQADILQALRPDGDRLTVVGDDAQSIYAFRAAEVDNILDFPDQFVPAAHVVSLTRNYRSVQPILDAANALIADSERQYRKDLYSLQPSEQKPNYVTVEDANAEVDYIVHHILAQREAGTQLRDQAVLFRNAHHSDRLEVELTRRNIPYVKYGGLKFLESAHVKDLLSILRWADNPKNRVAAFRVLQLLSGIGPSHAARCFEYVAANEYSLASLSQFTPPAAAITAWSAFCALMQSLQASADVAADGDHWQADVGQVRAWYQPVLEDRYDSAEQRLADLEQLEAVAQRYPSRERFLTELTLDPPQSTGDLSGPPLQDEDYLILSTVHSAKGQEWDDVFIMNVTDGNFPSEFAAGDNKAIDEERRLLYVAMTRAKRSLHVLSPMKFFVTQQHRHGDRHVYGARSRFMTDQLLSYFEPRMHADPAASGTPGPSSRPSAQVDVASRLRNMWQ